MESGDIYFHSESITFSLNNEKSVKEWVEKTIALENKIPGTINIIFCNDQYLLKVNQEYLNHDYFTDIITFNYVTNDTISGDLFISKERVEENAKQTQSTVKQELFRVIIHGILHLIGYDDKNPEDAQKIRAKEDFYLTLQP